jgi:hypothetical protein
MPELLKVRWKKLTSRMVMLGLPRCLLQQGRRGHTGVVVDARRGLRIETLGVDELLAVPPLGRLVKLFPDHLAQVVLGADEQVVQAGGGALGIEQLLHDSLGVLVQDLEIPLHVAGDGGGLPRNGP